MKVTSKFLAALLTLMLLLSLAACGGGGETPSGGGDKPTGTSTPETTESGTSAPARLTAGEAREIYNAWLVDHAELSDYTLSDENETYEWDGEVYHLFHAEEMSRYWYNILVHMETGELLFMMTPDGEDPETTVEPLDDWYNTHYAP